MVQRNANFRAVFGTTQGKVGTENLPGERPGRVLQTVEQSVVLGRKRSQLQKIVQDSVIIVSFRDIGSCTHQVSRRPHDRHGSLDLI